MNAYYTKPKIEILIYAKRKNKSFELLQKVIENVMPSNDIKRFNNIDTLCHQLNNSTITKNNKTITVLLIDDLEELQDLIKMRDKLTETRIIMILPDRDPETIKSGHALFPRYLDFSDTSFTEVGEVLRKITQTDAIKARK